MGWEGLARIDVEKSASHHLSQTEIDGDNPCSRHLSEKPCFTVTPVSGDNACLQQLPTEDGLLGRSRGLWQVVLGVQILVSQTLERGNHLCLTRHASGSDVPVGLLGLKN